VLTVRATGPCLLNVTVDDQRLLPREFKIAGERWRLFAQDHFVISAENAERLELRFDGQAVSLGSGSVVAVRLPPGPTPEDGS